jgi:hypothetical protein
MKPAISAVLLGFAFCANILGGVGIGPHPIDKLHVGKLWPIRKIPCYVEPSIPKVVQDMIDDALAAWTIANLPITFEPVKVKPQGAYVHFLQYSDRNCKSEDFKGKETEVGGATQKLGYAGNVAHYVCLNPDALTKGIIVHELGHIVGLGHEQVHCNAHLYISEYPKPDRFQTCSDVVSESANFVMLTDYDMQSIMHYPPMPPGGTLTPFGNAQAILLHFDPRRLGAAQFLSDKDEESIKKLYPPP